MTAVDAVVPSAAPTGRPGEVHPPGPAGISAAARVVIGPGRRGRPRLLERTTRPPLGMTLAGGDLYLMGTAGGPHGGDDLSTEVVVTPGTELTVRSVAATVALPGDGSRSQQRLCVDVGEGATVRWVPEPLVAAAGCHHRADNDQQADELPDGPVAEQLAIAHPEPHLAVVMGLAADHATWRRTLAQVLGATPPAEGAPTRSSLPGKGTR